MKKSTVLLLILTALLPLAVLAIVYADLPARIPIHYNHKMEVDRIGHKSELWFLTGIISVVSVLLFFILGNIHRFDPKRKNDLKAPAAFHRLGAAVLIFMSALSMVIVISSYNERIVLQNLIFPLLGMLFAFLGNYMINIKPNYIAGIRLPWTLNDDDNWKRTHQVGGRIWFWGGLLFAITSWAIPSAVVLWFFVGMVAIMVLIPVIYSYRLYRSKSNGIPINGIK